MLLIGLGNRARQGKDYVGKYMAEVITSPLDVRLYSFAKLLKEYCRDHHNELLPKWQLAHQTQQTPVHKNDPIYGCSAILQWWGSDVVRKATPNHWVDSLKEILEIDKPDIAIVTDVRFPNEAEFIKENGGVLVQVIRRNEDGTQYLDPGRDPNHSSETALDEYEGWDFIISCKSGDLNGLRSKALGVMANIINSYRDSIPDATGHS
jgi:hypothetical protein